ncbi:rhodanese-like domain-containing protein [Hymenobacter humi]|uniref:Rhodanese-like domain-containing protein n=1 Tax=Hymenobacter humi TaxID=1411620 RepID=A0ABW2U5F1_9BACT
MRAGAAQRAQEPEAGPAARDLPRLRGRALPGCRLRGHHLQQDEGRLPVCGGAPPIESGHSGPGGERPWLQTERQSSYAVARRGRGHCDPAAHRPQRHGARRAHPAEFAAGHLQGAQNLDFRAPDFEQQLRKLDPQGRYVVYCASGNRSGRASALMLELGIRAVTNAGGYSDLKAAGAK